MESDYSFVAYVILGAVLAVLLFRFFQKLFFKEKFLKIFESTEVLYAEIEKTAGHVDISSKTYKEFESCRVAFNRFKAEVSGDGSLSDWRAACKDLVKLDDRLLRLRPKMAADILLADTIAHVSSLVKEVFESIDLIKRKAKGKEWSDSIGSVLDCAREIAESAQKQCEIDVEKRPKEYTVFISFSYQNLIGVNLRLNQLKAMLGLLSG